MSTFQYDVLNLYKISLITVMWNSRSQTDEKKSDSYDGLLQSSRLFDTNEIQKAYPHALHF